MNCVRFKEDRTNAAESWRRDAGAEEMNVLFDQLGLEDSWLEGKRRKEVAGWTHIQGNNYSRIDVISVSRHFWLEMKYF